MGGDRLWEVSTYGRYPPMGGDRLWEVSVSGGSTVKIFKKVDPVVTPMLRAPNKKKKKSKKIIKSKSLIYVKNLKVSREYLSDIVYN